MVPSRILYQLKIHRREPRWEKNSLSRKSEEKKNQSFYTAHRFQMIVQRNPAQPTPPHNISSALQRLLWIWPTGPLLLFPFSSVGDFKHRVAVVRTRMRMRMRMPGSRWKTWGENKMNPSQGEHTVCQMEHACPCKHNRTDFFYKWTGSHSHPCSCFCHVMSYGGITGDESEACHIKIRVLGKKTNKNWGIPLCLIWRI